MWVLERNNRRYDEIEQMLYTEERDSTKWTDEQWKRLDLRARYRTTAERSCARALRNLAHVRSQRAGVGERQVMPKEEKKKAGAEKPLQLPSGGPPPLYQRVVVTVADGKASTRVYPTNEQLRRVIEDRAPETKLARIYEFLNGVPSEYGWAEGARSSWQIDRGGLAQVDRDRRGARGWFVSVSGCRGRGMTAAKRSKVCGTTAR